MFKNTYLIKKQYLLMIAGLFFIVMSSMMTACGNKGDLYLPEEGSKSDTKTLSKVKKKS